MEQADIITSKATKHISGAARVAMVTVCMALLLVLAAATVWEAFRTTYLRGQGHRNDVAPTASQPALSEAEQSQRKIYRAAKQFMPDGTIHLLEHVDNKPTRTPSEQVKIYDRELNLLWEGKEPEAPYSYISWCRQMGQHMGSQSLSARRVRQMGTVGSQFSRWLEMPVVQYRPGLYRPIQVEGWRYERNERVFAGLNAEAQPIGYCGANGFADSVQKAGRFAPLLWGQAWQPLEGDSPLLLWQSEAGIYEIDFQARRIEMLLALPSDEIQYICDTNWIRPSHSPNLNRAMLCAVTKDDLVHMVLQSPDRKLTLQLPRDLPGQPRIAFANGAVFLQNYGPRIQYPKPGTSQAECTRWRKAYNSKPQDRWIKLHRLADDGSIELVSSFHYVRPARPYNVPQEPDAFLAAAEGWVKSISPPLVRLMWPKHFRAKVLHNARGRITTNWEQFSLVLWEITPTNGALNLAICSLAALVAGWHGWARRTSWASWAFWILFVAALNITGLLTYLALNHRPVVRCETCGRKRSLATAACRACKAPLPRPKPKDTDLLIRQPS